jgi:hypothetical protein
MPNTVKILSYILKALGLIAVLDWTAISPKYGAVIFFVGSLLKDTVNRVGDYLDNGKTDNSFNG